MRFWPFAGLEPLAYDGVIIDPPWRFDLRSSAGEAKSPQHHYDCMSIDDIAALPVGHLLRGDAAVIMWATFPMLPLQIEVLRAWGLKYVSGGAWHKRSSTGRRDNFGPGYAFRSAAEPFLLGSVGSPRYGTSTRNLITAPVRGHSRKPDDQYALMGSLLPKGRRFAEVFATQRWIGGPGAWDSFGNQVDKHEVAA